MRALEFLSEKLTATPGDPASDPLYSLKLNITNKIKDLPPSEQTKNELDEIEDIITHAYTGSHRKDAAEKEFNSFYDIDVKKASKMLAGYIMAMKAPIESKKQMLTLWKDHEEGGGLINLDALTSGSHSMSDVVKLYGKNPAITELADTLIQVDSQGKGKGEFMLKVMSPFIKAGAGGKGDIEIDNFGKVEIKTNNSSPARFTDRKVKPTSTYTKNAEDFIKKYKDYFKGAPQPEVKKAKPKAAKNIQNPQTNNLPGEPMGAPPANGTVPANNQIQATPNIVPTGAQIQEGRAAGIGVSISGINMDSLLYLYSVMPDDDSKRTMLKELEVMFNELFPHVPDLVTSSLTAFMSKDRNLLLQTYARANVFNYLAVKTEEVGILFIDLKSKGGATFTFFKDLDGLKKGGLRFHMNNAYPVTTTAQNAYPGIKLVTTSH